MSNLYTFLAGFDPYNDDDEPMTYGDANDAARDMAQSEIFRHRVTDDDGDVTLDLELEQRLDFNATLLAIAQERQVQREIDLAWEQHEREEG